MKTTDVKDTKPLERSFLVTTAWRRFEDNNPHVLHITDTEGRVKKDHVYITRCHRILVNHELQNRLKIISPDSWKLCPRCGTPDDFQAVRNALQAYWDNWREQDRLKHAERERGYMWDDLANTIDRMIKGEASTTPNQVIYITVGDLLTIMEESNG